MKRTFIKKPVLASQERGTVETFRNNRNRNKYIEVKKGNDGHSYARQYMKWNTPDGEVKNYMGSKTNRGRYFRANRKSIDQMLEDYTPADQYHDIADDLEVFQSRRYGDYYCACGCGEVLDGICTSVGLKSDDEGMEWRTFTPGCWKRLSAKFEPAQIYELFDTNECVD